MYQVVLLPAAEEAIRGLDRTVQSRIAEKIDWMGENADAMVHHNLTAM